MPKAVTPLQPIIATRVFDHVMADLISFTVPSFGFKYVLIFKDVFSGFVKCYKLRDKSTKGVVKAFEDLVCFLGPPKLLTSRAPRSPHRRNRPRHRCRTPICGP